MRWSSQPEGFVSMFQEQLLPRLNHLFRSLDENHLRVPDTVRHTYLTVGIKGNEARQKAGELQ